MGGWREAAREQRDDERGKEVKTDEGNYLNILPLLPNKQEVPLTLHLRAPILLLLGIMRIPFGVVTLK